MLQALCLQSSMACAGPGLRHHHPPGSAPCSIPTASPSSPTSTSSPPHERLSTGSFSALLPGGPATAPHCPPHGYGRRGRIRSLVPSTAPQCPWELEAAGAAAVRELALKESWPGPHAAPPRRAQRAGAWPGMAVVRSPPASLGWQRGSLDFGRLLKKRGAATPPVLESDQMLSALFLFKKKTNQPQHHPQNPNLSSLL